jgi:cytochrome c oxidase cbb3-type subunit 3
MRTVAASTILVAGLLLATAGAAQQPPPAQGKPQVEMNALGGPGRQGAASTFLGVPVSPLSPGDVPIQSSLHAPEVDQAAASSRGMRYFKSMNCIGCHGANGGGGMGPALSNDAFIYGGKPEQIFLSIYQGRPRGMPAWGAMLPPSVIWDLVAYVRSISREPKQQWGRTISKQSPEQEQVPAEWVTTDDPWSHLEAFSHGQKPNSAK